MQWLLPRWRVAIISYMPIQYLMSVTMTLLFVAVSDGLVWVVFISFTWHDTNLPAPGDIIRFLLLLVFQEIANLLSCCIFLDLFFPIPCTLNEHGNSIPVQHCSTLRQLRDSLLHSWLSWNCRLKKHGLNESQAYQYFVLRAQKIALSHGYDIVNWYASYG